MSGHGNREITGLRFSLGSLVAFSWRPEGFWLFQNDGIEPFTPRMDRLINRFENNNYPDREGIADELRSDSRFEEKDRISTSDYLIKTWPPYERPVPPAFGVAANEKNQDPKEKEGKFSGKKITGTLKHKLPKNLSQHELAYPEEVKTNWFLHEPEHVVYFPEEGDVVQNRLDRMIQHYILEYTNELRSHAPFLAPLRGEYSPAQWIAEFCQRANVLAHENGSYPEHYVTMEDRVFKTRQFNCTFGFEWWMGENLRSIDIQIEAPSMTEQAQTIARQVVNAWIASPPHYANLIRFDTLNHVDLALLDVGKSGNVYSQVFMGAPLWLQTGLCSWQGLESWQVLSWKTVENSRYAEPYGDELYFKGKCIYQHTALMGAAIHQDGDQYYLLVFLLASKKISVIEAEFPFLKTLIDADFTEIAAYQQNDDMSLLQSFFCSRDGKKGICRFDDNKNKKYVIRYENRLLTVSSGSSFYSDDVDPVQEWTSYSGITTLIYSLSIHNSSSEIVVFVDYSDEEIILIQRNESHGRDEWTSNWPNLGSPLITTQLTEHSQSTSYSLNNIDIENASSSASSYRYSNSLSGTTEHEEKSGPTALFFIDLRKGVYLVDSVLSIEDEAFIMPFNALYTRQKIDGPGIYTAYPNLVGVLDYFFVNLLGCTFAEYENEWIFSAVGYQIDYEILDDPNIYYTPSIEVTSSTPIQYFLSSHSGITTLLNSLEKPFLVSVI